MDIIESLGPNTFTMAVICDCRELSVNTGILPRHGAPKPLYRILLRKNNKTIPYQHPLHRTSLHKTSFLTITEGALHWEITDDADKHLSEAKESGAFNINVKKTTPFVVHERPMADKYEDRVSRNTAVWAKFLSCEGLEPYHTDEDGECYEIPMDDALYSFVRATEQFGKLVDIRRNEWIWHNHPVYSHEKTPLITMALLIGFNKETRRSEIYTGFYRGSAPIAVGATVSFWGEEMTVVLAGVVTVKNKSLILHETDITTCNKLSSVPSKVIYQYRHKNHIKTFISDMSKVNLGSWHVSLQYANGKWYDDGKSTPVISKPLEDFLMLELERHQGLCRHALEEEQNEVNMNEHE